MKLKRSVCALLVLLLVLALPAMAYTTMRSKQKLTVNGKSVKCDIYNIDGANYFKLRDLAYLMNGTDSRFEVGWDGATSSVTITTGKAYTANGSELKIGDDLSATAQPSRQTIYINGVKNSELSVFNIGGNNYFKLRDLGNAVNFNVDYDAATATMLVESADYSAGKSGKVELPVEKAVASGTSVAEKGGAVIDYSNVQDGYVMVKFTETTDKLYKVMVIGPTTQYVYNLKFDTWATFPLSDGNGDYTVKVVKQASGTKYSAIVSVDFNVQLKDEFAPFLRPNQFVNYENAVNTVAKAKELTKNKGTALEKLSAIYDFVVANFTYDTNLAETVQSGYIPDLDKDLASKSGICFDFAAIMAGMLRSQKIPCKLVIGYAGDVYHAWLSVYSEEYGWVDGAVYFDGKTWSRMDPTFASTGGNTESIKQYIGDGSNYDAKYFY